MAIESVRLLAPGLLGIGLILGAGDSSSWLLTPESSPISWLSAHWVHIDSRHALLNAAGWGITVIVAARFVSASRFLLLTLLFMLGIAFGWRWLEPTIGYCGLSGVLFAWWSFIALQLWRSKQHDLATTVLAALALSSTGLPGSEGFTVAVSAHWIGMVLGASIGAFANVGFSCEPATFSVCSYSPSALRPKTTTS